MKEDSVILSYILGKDRYIIRATTIKFNNFYKYDKDR